jgi:hypothetical protein
LHPKPHIRGVAPVVECGGQALGQPDLAVDTAQDQRAEIRRQRSAIEPPAHAEAGDRGKTQLLWGRFGHGRFRLDRRPPKPEDRKGPKGGIMGIVMKRAGSGHPHRVFADGLRKPTALAWEPQTQALWVVVNERDELGSDLVPDYLTSVKDVAFYGALERLGQPCRRARAPAEPREGGTGDRPRLRLGPVIGPRGVDALLGRALHLANASFPWLALTVNDGARAARLASLKTRLAGGEPTAAAQAGLAVLRASSSRWPP